MALVKRLFFRHTAEDSFSVLLNQRVVLQFLKLLFRYILNLAVGIAARLPKVGLLKPVLDGHAHR